MPHLSPSELFQHRDANFLESIHELGHAWVAIWENIVECSVETLQRIVGPIDQLVIIVVIYYTVYVPILRGIFSHPYVHKVFPELVELCCVACLVNFAPTVWYSFCDDFVDWNNSQNVHYPILADHLVNYMQWCMK